MEELDLLDLFYMVRKRLWLIILLGILFCTSAYFYSVYMITPVYSTHATLMLGKPDDYNQSEAITASEIAMNQKLITTYAALAESDKILSKVQEALPFSASTGSLQRILDISLYNNTEIIKVTARGTSPDAITEIANTFSVVFAEQVAEIMRIDNVQVLDLAKVPYYPYSPDKTRNVMMAGAASVVLSLFIIFLLEMFDRTIKIPDEVQRHLGLPVLGTIPKHD